MKMILKFALSVASLMFVAWALAGVTVSGVYTAIIVALLLGLLNIVIRPILLFLTLPINILTLGLFTFVINGALFWFVASFVDGFDVTGFWVAFLGALIVSAVTYVGDKIIEE